MVCAYVPKNTLHLLGLSEKLVAAHESRQTEATRINVNLKHLTSEVYISLQKMRVFLKHQGYPKVHWPAPCFSRTENLRRSIALPVVARTVVLPIRVPWLLGVGQTFRDIQAPMAAELLLDPSHFLGCFWVSHGDWNGLNNMWITCYLHWSQLQFTNHGYSWGSNIGWTNVKHYFNDWPSSVTWTGHGKRSHATRPITEFPIV